MTGEYLGYFCGGVVGLVVIVWLLAIVVVPPIRWAAKILFTARALVEFWRIFGTGLPVNPELETGRKVQQSVVDQRLRDLAKSFTAACEYQKKAAAVGNSDVQEAVKADLEVARTKKAFWHAQNTARACGLLVREKVENYL